MAEIGIVVPVYNGAQYLAETLESVLAQTFADWELVIVDDGSTDGSATIAAAFAARDPRIRVVYKPNSGVATARNAGLRSLGSTSAFVAFLDQDDMWYPESLATLHVLLSRNPEASAAHGTYLPIDAAGHLKPRSDREALHWRRRGFQDAHLVRWPAERPTTFDVLAFMNPIVTPGQVLIRRSVLHHTGDFDRSLAPADDWDLWLRLARSADLVYTDAAVLRYRLHDANLSSRLDLMHAARRAVRRKHARSPSLNRRQRSLIVRGEVWVHWFVSELRLIWAQEQWERGNYVQAIKELRHAVRERYQFEGGRFRLRWHGMIRA